MASFTQLLLLISNSLLIPVILLLLGLLAGTAVYLGGLLAEAVARWRGAAFRQFVRDLHHSSGPIVSLDEVPASHGLPRLVFRRLAVAPFAADKLVDDAQLLSERLLARLSIGIRLGPVLGLAGTLIPLGPALVSLSTGDIATLSARLAVAFTTTVLGLVVGGACAVMHSIRKGWYMQDLSDIDYVVSRLEVPRA